MGLSVCMIVKNEEEMLGDALESVKNLADEIIVVDTGSIDKTVEIAESFDAKVYSYKWKDDFSDARNFSLGKATQEWILVLDADEIMDPKDYGKIRGLMNDLEVAGYAFEQRSYTSDVNMHGYINMQSEMSRGMSGYISCNILRMFRNNLGIKFQGAVHESIDDSAKEAGVVKKSEVIIHHYQFLKGDEVQQEKQLKYLEIYEKNIDKYPNKARAYRDMGIICYQFLKDYSRAIRYFTKSLALNSSNVKTYVGLAACYIALRKYGEAASIIDVGLKLFPKDPTLRRMLQLIQNQR